MATETEYASSHLAGTCATPNNALGAADGTFTTNTGNTSWTSRWAMGDPTDPLTSNTQTIEIAARRSGAGNGQPTWVMTLYENGTSIASIGSGTVSTATATLTGTFAGSVITNRANVEIELAVTGNGGGPNAQTLQIDAITWTADTSSALNITPTGPTVTVTAGTLSVVEDQPITPTGPTVSVAAGTLTVTTAGSNFTEAFAYSDGALSTVSSGAWADTVNSGWNVSSNAIVPDGTGAFKESQYQTGYSSGSYYIKGTLTLQSGSYNEAGFMIGTNGSTGGSGYYAYVANNGNWEILDAVTATSFTSLNSGTTSVTTGSPTEIELRLNTSTGDLSLRWNGSEIGTANDPTFTGGFMGVASYTDGPLPVFDDIEGGDFSTSLTITPTGPTVTVSAGTVTVSAASTQATIPVGASVAVTPGTVTVSSVRYPNSISGRKVLDQNGDVFLGQYMSSWGLVQNLTEANVTAALEDVAASGFKGVVVFADCGYALNGTWTQYQSGEGNAMWTGTAWQSSLGSGWAQVDHAIEECARLGLVFVFSFCGGFGTTGGRPDWDAATNAQMTTAGEAIATRYAGYPHIQWHVMFDDTVSATTQARVEALFQGIENVEGSTARPVRWCEVDQGFSTQDRSLLNLTYSGFNIDCEYDYGDDSTVIIEGIYGESTGPVGDSEPPYVGAPHYTGNEWQQLRERTMSVFIEGGVLLNFGHEDWWPFGATGIYTDGETWDTVHASTPLVEQSYLNGWIDQYIKDSTWAPGSWVTTGEGTGDTKAAVGLSNTVAMAYFPSTRTVEIDTTVLSGTNFVSIKWLDPTTGAVHTTVTTGEAQQTGRSVTYPTISGRTGTNSGTTDLILLVELTADQPITPTGPTVTVSAGVPAITVDITPVGASVTVTPGTVSLSQWITFADGTSGATGATVTGLTNDVAYEFRVTAVNAVGQGDWSNIAGPYTPTDGAQAISPVGPTVSVTAGTLSVAPGAVDVTPVGPTITVTAGTPALELAVSPVGPTVTVTAGTLTLDLAIGLTGATVNVTPGNLAVGPAVLPTGPTITVTPGSLTVAPGAVGISPVAPTVTVTAGTLTVSLGASPTQEVTPAAPTITVTAGTLSLGLSIAPTAPTVTVTPGTASVFEDLPLTVDAPTVNVTPGTLTITQGLAVVADGPTVNVTAGTLTVTTGAVDVTPVGPTVTVTPGTLTVLLAQPISLVGPTVSVSAGTLTVIETQPISLVGPTVSVTAGTVTLTVSGPAPIGVTITVTPGTLDINAGLVPERSVYAETYREESYAVDYRERGYAPTYREPTYATTYKER